MENNEDSENNAKVSDSGYSNSCSNSQSRSHSSKSTHSGSNSSGSSGYGGKPSSSSNAATEAPEKSVRAKDKETNKKIQPEAEIIHCEEEENIVINLGQEHIVEELLGNEDVCTVLSVPSIPSDTHAEVESMDISSCGSIHNFDEDFTCVVSMHDGVVMYTTSSLTTSLGYPKDMWIGRSFIDFLNPQDRSTFASQITNCMAIPKAGHGSWASYEADAPQNFKLKMFCRLRKYRGLSSSFGVKKKDTVYIPFLLILSFKNILDENTNGVYLVIQAIPFYSAFTVPNEVLPKPMPFVLRHSASGKMEYIDPESVPYLGYLPQDLVDKNALQLFHPDDVGYIEQIYEALVKKGKVTNSEPYRMLCRNSDYVKMSTEWSAISNPWSRKLEYVIAKHVVIEGPANPNVFHLIGQEAQIGPKNADKDVPTQFENILRVMNEVMTKPAEIARENINKRCQQLKSLMEGFVLVSSKDNETEKPKIDDELRLDIQDAEMNYEKDSVLMGVISPHHTDNSSSTTTLLSYTQLNYNETLQRYFDSYVPLHELDNDDYGFTVPVTKEKSHVKPVIKSTKSAENIDVTKYEKRLTQAALNKHNSEMEKNLAKIVRENRSVAKSGRQKVFNVEKQKKKQHIARCNATYTPTMTEMNVGDPQVHGLKRMTEAYPEVDANANNGDVLTPKRKKQKGSTTRAAKPTEEPSQTHAVFPGAIPTGFAPRMMPVVSPVVSGVVPLYYLPTATPVPAATDSVQKPIEMEQSSVQYLMYLQAVFGSAYMYTPIAAQTQNSMPQNVVTDQPRVLPQKALGLDNSNYVEACKQHVPPVTKVKKGHCNQHVPPVTKVKKGHRAQSKLSARTSPSPKPEGSGEGSSDLSTIPPQLSDSNGGGSNSTSFKIPDSRTEEASSYSSLYSSFFKTDSGSAEDSDGKPKPNIINWGDQSNKKQNVNTKEETKQNTNVAYPKKKTEAPWMEKINLTPELIFKYQIEPKNMDDVLKADKLKMEKVDQPFMVQEQMQQLLKNLQLEGEAEKLNFSEGLSSSSSEEETEEPTKIPRWKRNYSETAMLFEENAPFPPSPKGDTANTEEPIESTMDETA